MTDRPRGSTGLAVPAKAIIGGTAIGLLLAAAAYGAFMTRPETSGMLDKVRSNGPQKAVGSLKGKWALNALIQAIEHDTSRKLLLAVLRAMAKRA
jgi:hypothetical protein